MRIFKLNTNPKSYSSNAYLVLGLWGTIDDSNVIVDTGVDDFILSSLENIYTGVGKKPVNKVVITHQHFDHTGGIKILKEKFNPEILAFNYNEYVTKKVKDADKIKMGDSLFEVLHVPCHSADSIMLVNWENGILFSGDTNLDIKNKDGVYEQKFIDVLERLCKVNLKIIYPGHGNTIELNIESMLKRSFENIEDRR